MKDWLYPFPSFFNQNLRYRSVQNEIEQLDLRLDIDFKNNQNDNLRETLIKILKEGANEWTHTDESSSKFMWSSVIVRLARHMRGESNVRWCFPELLEEYLHEIRTIEKAKKMFQYVQGWCLSNYKTKHLVISTHFKRQMP